MKKSNSLWLMFAVWGLAAMSAVALAYVLNRPLVVASVAPALAPMETAPIVAPPAVPEERVIVLQPLTILGSRAVVVAPPAVKQLHCTDMQPLSQGPAGAKVRYCE
jgi:hypothetical protein